MISIINFRKQKLIDERKCFKDENEVKNHIDIIKEEIKVANKDLRMIELKNWLNSIVS